MRAARTRRLNWFAHHLRFVVKCAVLFVRLLRSRPPRQKAVVLFLVALPCVLLGRLAVRRASHVVAASSGIGSFITSIGKRPAGYNNDKHSTLPEGGPEGGSALPDAFMRTFPEGGDSPLRLQSAPPAKVRIAYFVQVGADSIDLVPRLLRAMHHVANVYVVHVDAKVNDAERDFLQAYIDTNATLQANVHIMPAEMVTYKGVSMALNTLSAMALALRVDPYWHYFINLSGSDYPLLSADAQRALLGRPGVPLGRLNFMTLFPRKQWRPYAFRIRYMHWDPAVSGARMARARLRVFRGLREDPLEARRHFTFGKAEAWMILSRPFVRFLTRSGFAKRLLLAHLHTRSAPEHYFANVLINHPAWRRTLVPDALRKVVWYHRGRRSGQHPYVLDAGRSPFSFWDDLRWTRSLFARKFSRDTSPLMRRIDWRLSGYRDAGESLQEEVDEMPEDDAQENRLEFLQNLAAHFDDLTQQTLKGQGLSWPSSAYPPIKSAQLR